MSFRAAFTSKKLSFPTLAEPSSTARLLAKLSSVHFGVVSRPSVDLNQVAHRFISDLEKGRNPGVQDWNKIAWCIWTTVPAVAENDRALDAVLGRVARMQRKRPYRQLASVYLTEFATDRPRMDRIAQVLSGYAPAAGDPWTNLNTRYNFFSGSAAAVGMARIALSPKANVQEFLRSVGLSPALTETGFAEIMHAAGLSILRITPVTTAPERLEIVRRWCLGPTDKLFFPNWRREMARAVALPFGNTMPTQADRDVISNFLVGRFGDPRINRAAWIGLEDVADILKRWLTEQSLRQFFDVVDRIAPDGAWKYRRKFWLAYHNQGLVKNAWVVFGADGAAEAQRSFGREIHFGVFNSAGQKNIQRGHAVLLLDFGQCVVADWSYSGYCNIWPSNSSIKPPALNLARYSSDDVRRALPTERTEYNLTRHDIFGHGGSEKYVWQNRVARRLQDLIGVRVSQYDYSVR
jgi:hypothetical protein